MPKTIVDDRWIIRYTKICKFLGVFKENSKGSEAGSTIRRLLMDNNLFRSIPKNISIDGKHGEIYYWSMKAELFYLMALNLNSMSDVRPTPDIKFSMPKRQLNMAVQN